MSPTPTTRDLVQGLRDVCLPLPESSERTSYGEPAWFVCGKRRFVTYAGVCHSARATFWCPAPPGVQESMVAEDPERFFRPPYVGHRGWLGVCLDIGVDWAEIAEIVEDAYRVVAPKRLIKLLE